MYVWKLRSNAGLHLSLRPSRLHLRARDHELLWTFNRLCFFPCLSVHLLGLGLYPYTLHSLSVFCRHNLPLSMPSLQPESTLGFSGTSHNWFISLPFLVHFLNARPPLSYSGTHNRCSVPKKKTWCFISMKLYPTKCVGFSSYLLICKSFTFY